MDDHRETHTEPPAMVSLRPGVPVLRRDHESLQLGVGPAAVLVRDDRERELARALARGPVATEDLARPLPARWWAAGLLVDAAAWQRDRARWPGLADTAYACDPPSAHARLRRRAATPISLVAPGPWVPELRRLLADAGLGEGGVAEPGERPARVPDDESGEVSLVVTAGEPAREPLDALVHRGTPHLLVRVGADRILLGPFVVPGRTACLRCEDAHHTDADARWPLLAAQLARPAPPAGRAPEPVLLTWAWAWAARDLATYAEGGLPATWSTRITAAADLSLHHAGLLRHPHCGCAWGDMLREAGPAA